MSSSESTLVSTNPRRRMFWLVVAHVVVGPMGAFVANLAGRSPTLRAAAFLGLVFSQTSLLGIWGGLGTSAWWRRLIGVVVGVGYLGLLLGVGMAGLDRRVFLLVILTTTFVVLPLLIVRLFRRALRLDASTVASVNRIQFSIRHLMILTFVVACLMTIGKWVQPHALHGEILFLLLLFGATFGVIGILPTWFVLATRQPVLYSVGLAAVGAGAGYCFARFSNAGNKEIWMTAAATEAVAVAVTLLVVRSCGYRLVRLGPSRTGDRSTNSDAC